MLNINGTLMRICHPASWRGSGLITTPYPGLTPRATESVALTGSKFLGFQPDKHQFIEISTQTLGHVC